MARQKISVVLGGGIIGLSIAVCLAERGLSVTLVSVGGSQLGASQRSLSWINSFGDYPEAYHRLRLHGLAEYERLAGSEAAVHIHLDGAVFVPSADGVDRLLRVAEALGPHDYPVELMTPEEAESREPAFHLSGFAVDTVAWVPREGWVDLPGLAEHYRRRLAVLGVQVISARGPSKVVSEDGRAIGVQLPDGNLLWAESVVVAVGADTPDRVLADTGFVIPAENPTAALVYARPSSAIRLRTVLNSPHISLRPGPRGSIAFDTNWSVNAFSSVSDEAAPTVSRSELESLVGAAAEVLADHRLEVLGVSTGLKPVPADGFSVIGEIPGISGYFVAYTHSGATLAPAIATGIAELLLDETPSNDLSPFAPARFLSDTVAVQD